jgi:hypothetical protein
MTDMRCLTAVALIGLLPACFTACGLSSAQKKLMRRQADELKQISRHVMKQLLDTKKYQGKTIYIKVKVIEKADKKFSYKVESISTDKPENLSGKTGIVVLTGKITPREKDNTDKKFKLDLKYVMPPDETSPTAKTTAKQTNK